MRDSKGRFVRGHPLLNERDESTGRFKAKTTEPDIILKPTEETTTDKPAVEPTEVKSSEKKAEDKPDTIVKHPLRVIHRWMISESSK